MNRAISALIGVVFVLAGMSGFAHEAATTHVRCAAHGEMMHGGPRSVDTSAATHGRVSRRAAGTVRDHDHCALASAMRESRVAPHVLAAVAAPSVAVSLASPTAARSTSRTSQLYRSAPKTSPPATLA